LNQINRKNPLFYSLSKKAYIGDNEKNCVIAKKEDEKFNEFKQNLLEELKVLKEANNIMRERNIFNGKKPKPAENRWLSEFFEKRGKKEKIKVFNEMETTIKSKNYMKQEINTGNNSKIDNFIDKSIKYSQMKNIYSSPKINSLNGFSNPTEENRNLKEKNNDALQENLSLISSTLNFDIRAFIRDLAAGSKKAIGAQEPLKTLQIEWRRYCSPRCKVEIIVPETHPLKEYKEKFSQTVEVEIETNPMIEIEGNSTVEIEANPAIEIEANPTIEILVPEPTESDINSCLNSLYDQVVKKVKSKKKSKKSIENHQNNNENPNRLLIESSLNEIYDAVIHQQKKRKSSKPHPEKILAINYLDGLYNDICKMKVQENLEVDEIFDLNKIKHNHLDLFDPFDKVITGTFQNAQESLLWIYYKAKLKTQNKS